MTQPSSSVLKCPRTKTTRTFHSIAGFFCVNAIYSNISPFVQRYVVNGLAMLMTFFIFRVAMFPYVINLFAHSINVDFFTVSEKAIIATRVDKLFAGCEKAAEELSHKYQFVTIPANLLVSSDGKRSGSGIVRQRKE